MLNYSSSQQVDFSICEYVTTKVIRKSCHVKKIPSQEAKEVPRPFLQDHGMDQPLEISERRESIIITFHGRTAATLPGTD